MQTFIEWLREEEMIESFDKSDNYKRLSKTEMDITWLNFYEETDVKLLGRFYEDRPMMKMYIAKNEGREYIIYSYIKNGIFEVHFYDKHKFHDEESANLKLTKNATKVFGAVIDIVLKELEERPSRKIKIASPDGRENLYKKIIDKVLRDNNIFKKIYLDTTTDNELTKHNFILEKQNTFYIGIE